MEVVVAREKKYHELNSVNSVPVYWRCDEKVPTIRVRISKWEIERVNETRKRLKMDRERENHHHHYEQ